MARVPRADQQIRTQPLNPVFSDARGSSAAAFGGREGGAALNTGHRLEGLGNTLQGQALQIQRDANLNEAKDLDVEFTSRKREMLKAFDAKRGKDRVLAAPQLIEDLNKLQSDTIGRGSNKRVKEMVSRQTHNRLDGDFNRIGRAVNQAQFEHAESIGEARRAHAAADMAADYTNPQTIRHGLSVITNEVLEQGDRNGWDDEVTASQLRQTRTAALDQTVTAALNQGDTEMARSILEDFKDKIDGSARAALSKSIRNLESDKLEQEDTQAVLDRFGDQTSEAHKFIRENWTGTERDRRMSRYNTRVAEINRDRRIADDNALTIALQSMQEGGRPEDVDGTTKQRLIDAGDWGLVIQAHERAVTGTEAVSDRVWLHENYYSLSPEEQAQVPLAEIAPHVSTDDFFRFVEQRQGPVKPFHSQTESSYITARLRELNLNPRKDKDREEIDQFHRTFENEVNALQEEQGRKLTEAERRRIIDALTVDVRLDSFLERFIPGNGPTRAASFDLEAISEDTGIPTAAITSIISAIQRDGREVTVEEINAYWNEFKDQF